MGAVRWTIDTAGAVTGTRFRLIVASSSVATALIIGSSLASGGDSGLASQLRAALAALGGSSSAPAAAPLASTPPAAGPAKSGGPSAPVSGVHASATAAHPTTQHA